MKKLPLLLIMMFVASCKNDLLGLLDNQEETALTELQQFQTSANGTWTIGCHTPNPAFSMEYTVTITNSTFTFEQKAYRLTGCTPANFVATATATGTINFQGLTSSGANQLYAVDLTITEHNYTSYDIAGYTLATIYAGNNFCGFNDWSTGVQKSILGGLNCNQFGVQQGFIDFHPTIAATRSNVTFNASEILYFSIGISNDGSNLYIGDFSTGNGTTPGNRPSSALTQVMTYNSGSADYTLPMSVGFTK